MRRFLGVRLLAVAAVTAGTALCVAASPATAGASARRPPGASAQSQPAAVAAANPPMRGRTRGVIPSGGIKSSKTGGNTIDAELREEAYRADGYRHYDSVNLIQRLRAMNANTYLFGIWESLTDWDDLRREFAPMAR